MTCLLILAAGCAESKPQPRGSYEPVVQSSPTVKTKTTSVITDAVEIDMTQDGIYQSGNWEYRFRMRGPVREGIPDSTWGTLRHGGEELNTCAVLAKEELTKPFFIETPWGKMYWARYSRLNNGPHGFVPPSLVRPGIIKAARVMAVADLIEAGRRHGAEQE